jgi:hypothetical protein
MQMSDIEKNNQADGTELSPTELSGVSGGGKHMDPPPPPAPVGGGGGYVYDPDSGKKHVL